MKQLYEQVSLSKQAHLSYINRRIIEQQDEYIIINAIVGLRDLHPQMGAKKMYHILKPENIGRDKFMVLAMENGYGIRRQKDYQRTTYNSHIYKYKNLINGIIIDDINKVWASDITYYMLNDIFYYLTFIVDLYSRRILGSIAYTSLEARANLYALNMSFKIRADICYEELIHHSDRGTQYTSIAYTNALLKKNIKISMCDSVYENTHIERVNGIIKNEYLRHWTINNFSELKVALKKAVYLYNFKRPHLALKYMTPVEYENYLESIPKNQRKGLQLYTINTTEESNKNINQLELFDL
jgi:transposase InsO family protein